MDVRAWVREQPRQRLIVGVAATAVVLLVTIALVWTSLSPTAVAPSATPGASATPRATPAGEWTALDLPPYEPQAELRPEVADGSGIDTTTALTLRSLTGVPAVELAAGLRVDPAVGLSVLPGETSDLARVIPTEPLIAGARYRFQLLAPDGALAEEWSFRTGGPLHVVRTLPGHMTTGVPLDSGIEIEFDQDGVVGLEDHVTIQPALAGHFEEHGRTWAFVPSANLAAETMYTVVVTRGIGIDGSEQVLEEDVTVQFETASASSSLGEALIVFGRSVQESLPGEQPVLQAELWGSYSQGQTVSRKASLYRLPGVDRAVEAARRLSVDYRWATWSSTGNVAPEGLSPVATVDVSVTAGNGPSFMALPVALEAGWYLVEIVQTGRDAQVLIQVTDMAAYAVASRTRTLAWVNDLAAGTPITGASVGIAGGTVLGATDASGLLDVATPAPLKTGVAPHVLVVSAPGDRSVIVPLRSDAFGYRPFAAEPDWWQLFATDRNQYRRDDTIHAWGLVRSRADRSVPERVELRLAAGWDPAGALIARVSAQPTARGVFTADLPIRRMPLGDYSIGLYVGGELVGTRHVSVSDIRKPSFRIDVATDKRAYLQGENVDVRAEASFYDGSTAPGLMLRVYASGVTREGEQTVSVGRSGAAQMTLVAHAADGRVNSGSVGAGAAQPEEGWSYGNAVFNVLPASIWVTADAALRDATLIVEGNLAQVDFARADEQVRLEGGVTDPSGAPLPRAPLSVRVVHVTWVPREVGTTYDFLQKRRVPLLQYDRHQEDVGTFSVRSAADGSYALEVPVTSQEGSYEVTVTAVDSAGRQMRTDASAMVYSAQQTQTQYPYLEARTADGEPSMWLTANLGENVTLTLRDRQGARVSGSTALFVVASNGIVDAVLTGDGGLDLRFEPIDLPSATVRAVQLTPAGYVVTEDVSITVEPSDVEIDVALEADRDAYAPGGRATVSITTTGPDGSPIAADVVVTAIDAKLFAIGAASEIDTWPLMQPVYPVFIGSYASHRVNPTNPWGDGYGASTGGGSREDFEDLATFQRISTDAAGHGAVTFDLPDDLTSWRVSAAAMSDGLESGSASIDLPSTLALFVDAAVAGEYLVGEQATLQLRAFGDALEAGDAVRFTVNAPSLGMARQTIEGIAFQAVGVPLPELVAGEHKVTISVEQPGATPAAHDAVVRTIHVVPSRLRTLVTAFSPMAADFSAPGGDGLTTYVIADAGRAAMLPMLQQVAAGATARFDTALAAELARTILVEEFGISEASLPASGYDSGRATGGALALLPYDSPDLFLSARTALVAPERTFARPLRAAFLGWSQDGDATRERRIVALAGLAALGSDELGALRELAAEELTIREQLWLALGLAAGGDRTAARVIERELLAEHGRRLGQWVRIEAPNAAGEGAEATALMLLLSANLGDPIATDLARYLLENPSNEQLASLEQVGYARAALVWLPREAARFAWTLDGERHVQDLEGGTPFLMTLTAEQRAAIAFEPLSGQLVVAASWAGEADYGSLPSDPQVKIERTVTPADDAPSDQLVHVSLKVTIGANAPDVCYQVSDLVPSGLSPVIEPIGLAGDPNTIGPYEVAGQRVSWCVTRDTAARYLLAYTAHVVTPGTYRWEPAVAQSVASADVGNATRPGTYTIR